MTKRKPLPEQIEKYLTSPNPKTRLKWARRMDYTPTPEQIERGLADENWRVREAWKKRLEAMKHAQEKAVDEMLDDIVEF